MSLIRDGEKGGKALWKGGGGGTERLRLRRREIETIIPIATLSPPEVTAALRWAVMRAILMFH